MVNDSVVPAPRILVIDDNPAIHSDFRKILGSGGKKENTLNEARAALFGAAMANVVTSPTFDIDIATQGQEGLALVQSACTAQRPYALAFVDMRMPPGWDGVETTVRIWQQDPQIQVVICTAYSDYSWDEMLQKLGGSDRLFILKKPFDNIEVLQLANALTEKWRLAQLAQRRIHDLESQVAALSQQLQRLTHTSSEG